MKFILTLTLALCLITQATAFSRKLTFSVLTPPPPKAQSFHYPIAHHNNANLGTIAGGSLTAVPPVYSPFDFQYQTATVTTTNSANIISAVTIALDLAHIAMNKIFQVNRALVNPERIGAAATGAVQIPLNAIPMNQASPPQGVIDSIVLPAADYDGNNVVVAGVAGSAGKDLYIYVGGSTTMTGVNATVWAYSDIFAQYSANSRPMFGYITVNDALFTSALTVAQQEQFNNAILAEVLHIMGFDFGILDQISATKPLPFIGYSDPDKLATAATDYLFFVVKSYYIQTPSLTQYATIYYDELPNVKDRAGHINGFGLPIVKGLGGKIMWNSDTFPGEIMTGGNKLSIFTLLVLQDLGFYSVDLSQANFYNFGKGHAKNMWDTAECEAATAAAALAGAIQIGSTGVYDNTYFCTPDQTFVISSLYDTASTCLAFSMTATPPRLCNQVVSPPSVDCTVSAGLTAIDVSTIDDYGQIFGINSAPFISTVAKPSPTGTAPAITDVRCHQAQCNDWGNQIIITLWGGKRFLCLTAGDETISEQPFILNATPALPAPGPIDSVYASGDAQTGYIKCPHNISEFCQTVKNRCPNKCSLKGWCSKGTCICPTGLTAADCSA